jgi:hypothetical protein
MSAWSDFFTQPGFWIGTPVGTIVGGLGGAWINAHRSKASDTFKAAQEDKTNAEKREHDEKVRKEARAHDEEVEREKRAYQACTEFYTLATEVLTNSIDVKGTFNSIRDAYYNSTGEADPVANLKIEFAADQTAALIPLGQVHNKVKFNAPKEIVSHSAKLYQSLAMIVQTTTNPPAKEVAIRTAGEQLDTFINAYRTFYGLETYSMDDAKRDTATYLQIYQKQTIAFLEEARKDMGAAEFLRAQQRR